MSESGKVPFSYSRFFLFNRDSDFELKKIVHIPNLLRRLDVSYIDLQKKLASVGATLKFKIIAEQ